MQHHAQGGKAMANQLFTNVMIFDASGRAPFPGEVLVQGSRIKKVAEGARQIARDEAGEVVDGQGMTLMPGMTEGHCHMSFIGVAVPAELGETPPEEHTLGTMHNARLLLDHGFTSVYAAASAKPRLDVVIRNEVNAGRIPGPRIRAASPEITVTAGLGDERKLHLHRESFALIADGVDEILRICRMCIREGVDNLKINISGDEFVSHCKAEMTVMMDDEIAAAVAVAHDFGKQIACHARAANSVKRAVRHGVDVIYHCDYADEEALDLLESVRDKIFVGPAVGLLHNTLYEAEAYGMTREVCEKMASIARWRLPRRPTARCASAASGSCQGATTASPGRRRAPTRATSSISSSCSAIRRPKRCFQRPRSAAS
jgi:imidazolonepropionase-like amidohydrolase